MAQTAVDAQGNKIRWDESKKEWVPVERAVNDRGVEIEYDGAKWNPVYKTQPKPLQPGAVKVAPARTPLEMPKRPGVLPALGEAVKETGKQIIAPVEGAVRTAAGIPSFFAGLGASLLSSPFTGWEKAKDIGVQVSGAMMGGGARLGGERTAAVEEMFSPLFAPAHLAIETLPKALSEGDPNTEAMLGVAFGLGLLFTGHLRGQIKSSTSLAKLKELVTKDKTYSLKQKSEMVRGIKSAEATGAKTAGDIAAETGNPYMRMPIDVVKKQADMGVELAKKALEERTSGKLQPPPTPTGDPIADAAALERFSAVQRAREAGREQVGFTKGEKGDIVTGEKLGIETKPIEGIKTKPITGINQTAEQMLVEALKKSKAIQPQQQALYTQERGKRIGRVEEVSPDISGRARYQEELNILRGELPKVDFEPLNLPGEVVDVLLDRIQYSNALHGYEKIGTKGALLKMERGKFPAPHEVKLLNKVFGGELMDVLMRQMSTGDKIWYWGGQIANIPRTLMASFDLSAPLRQGIFMIGRPKKFFGAFGAMFRSFAKEAKYNEVMAEISRRPTYELMKESGLDITGVRTSLRMTEEPYLGADILSRGAALAEKKLPPIVSKPLTLIPKGVEASQRAYTAYLNKLRADVFDSLVNNFKEMGLYDVKERGGGVVRNISSNPKLTQDLAWYINAATGRGHLPDLAMRSSDILNAVFFSPRLMSSRLTLLNPATYLNPARSKAVRLEAFSDFGKSFTVFTTISALAYLSGRENLGADFRSADFSKIKMGNTRIDLSGGFGQYIRTALQVSLPLLEKLGLVEEAELVSSKSGRRMAVGGGFNETSVREILVRFFSHKQSPIASLIWDALGQRSHEGGEFKLGKELLDRITPMIAEDIIDAAQDDPTKLRAIIVGTLVMFGAGAQTYGPSAEKSFLDQSGEPYRGGDKVIDELNRLGLRYGIGAKEAKGVPISDEDIDKILKQNSAEFRKRIMFYLNNPAYQKKTDAEKKALLQKAIEAGRKAAKDRYRLGAK